MTHRLVKFTVNDIAADSDSIAERLNKVCSGGVAKYRVRGVCQVNEHVVFALLPCAPEELEIYSIVELSDSSEERLDTELADRWKAGFDAVGTIDLGEGTTLLVVAKQSQA